MHTRDLAGIRGLGDKQPRLLRALRYSVFISVGVPISLVFVGEVALLWTTVSYQLLIAGLVLLLSFSLLFVRLFTALVELSTGSSGAAVDGSD